MPCFFAMFNQNRFTIVRCVIDIDALVALMGLLLCLSNAESVASRCRRPDDCCIATCQIPVVFRTFRLYIPIFVWPHDVVERALVSGPRVVGTRPGLLGVVLCGKKSHHLFYTDILCFSFVCLFGFSQVLPHTNTVWGIWSSTEDTLESVFVTPRTQLLVYFSYFLIGWYFIQAAGLLGCHRTPWLISDHAKLCASNENDTQLLNR